MADAHLPPGQTPQQTANFVSRHMLAHDQASRHLGIRIVSTAPGTATLAMTVRADMLNGHHVCHGGFMATLADTAFAFACNSYNEMTVASGFSIDFSAPAALSDTLIATCTEVHKGGRTGLYDTRITNQDGLLLAVFRGRAYTIKGKPAIDA